MIGDPNDPSLRDLIEAVDEGARDRAVDSILARVGPLIERQLTRAPGRWLRNEEISDVRGAVQLRLLNCLRMFGPASTPITHLDAYVVALSNNAIRDYLRQRYPERARLRSRIRYLLMHDADLALWSIDGVPVCGMREWQAAGELPAPVTISTDCYPDAAFEPNKRTAVKAIFECLQHPLLLDDMIELVQSLWQVCEVKLIDASDVEAPSAVSRFEERRSLEALWSEIRLLPARQRTALLLNLRDADGGNALALLVLLGIATFKEVATTAGIDQLRLAELWPALPLHDLEIAGMLSISRQQVINLRMTTRRRLARRMERRAKGRS